MHAPYSFGKGLKTRRCLTCGEVSGDNIGMYHALKLWTFLLALGLSCLAHAEITLKIYRPDVVDEDELEIKVPMTSPVNSSTFQLEVDLPSDTASSLDSAAKTFVPVLGTPKFPEASIYSHNSSPKADDLPQADAGVPPVATLTFEKEITITSGDDDLYLHAAVANSLNDSDWRVIGLNTSPIPPSALEERHKVSFSTENFCNNSDLLECDDLVASEDAVMAQVYFFLADTQLPFNSEIDPEASQYNHGVYYEVHLSSDVHTADTGTPSADENLVKILDLSRGDESLSLNYKSDFTIEHLDRVIVAQYLDSGMTTGGGLFIGSNGTHGALKLFGNTEADEFPTSTEGDLLVEPLTNGEAATLSVAYVDKFGFVTPLSKSQTETPLEIEVLLQEESCFFFTAGFGREHWVIDELKKFRDQVLKTSPLGSVLVDIYYALAPQYAYIILEHPWLQTTVRGIAYFLVFMIQGARIFFALTLLILSFFAWRYVKRKPLFNFSTKP